MTVTAASGKNELERLRALARLHSVQTAFTDTLGRRRIATPEALRAVLGALGVAAATPGEVEESLRRHDQQAAPAADDAMLYGGTVAILLRRALAPRSRVTIQLEEGTAIEPELGISEMSGKSCSFLRLAHPLPHGYHALRIEENGTERTSTLLAPPPRVAERAGRRWAVFAPLYALWRENRERIADLRDAEELSVWAASRGASAFATLPLLASYLDEPFDPSPYAPVSRLFWNELYFTPEEVPELASSAEAQRLLDAINQVRPVEPLVDYRARAAEKRQLLAALSRAFFGKGSETRRAAFEAWREATPLAARYARFRAVTAKSRRTWPLWPAPFETLDFDREEERYHLYAQWVMSEQMSHLGTAARGRDCGLYLDFPLGSNAHGFDVWHEERLFVRSAAIGAPPDLAYSSGQNWGFRPPHPDEFRRDGYRHIAACLRQQMQVASVLRLDHVMGLHRMYWVPDGFPADQGVYVRNHAEELYAVLAIESQRSGCEVVGEDLGTVPAAVRSTMKRTGVKRLFVLQRQLAHLTENPPGEIFPEMVASINTHDMHPFAAFWSGADIEEKLDLGVIPAANRERELQRREEGRQALLVHLTRNGFLPEGEATIKEILRATLQWLAGSRASIVLLNLEDLWLETMAQNVPTTTFQRPNWRPRLKLSLERLMNDPEIDALLALVKESQKAEGRRQKFFLARASIR